MKSYYGELFIIYVSLLSGAGDFYEGNDYFDSNGIPFIPFNRLKPYFPHKTTNSKVNNIIIASPAFLNTEKNFLRYKRECGSETSTMYYNSVNEYNVSESKRYLSKVIKEASNASSDAVRLLLPGGTPQNTDSSYNDTFFTVKSKNKDSFSNFFDSLLSLLSCVNPELLDSLEKDIRNTKKHTNTKRNSMAFNETTDNGTIRSIFCDCEYCKTGVPNMALLIVSGKKLQFNTTYHKMKLARDHLMENHSSNNPQSTPFRHEIKSFNGANFVRKLIADVSSSRDELILKAGSRKLGYDVTAAIKRKTEVSLTASTPGIFPVASERIIDSIHNPDGLDSSTFSHIATALSDKCTIKTFAKNAFKYNHTNYTHGITESNRLIMFLNGTEATLVKPESHANNNSKHFSTSDVNSGNTKQILISEQYNCSKTSISYMAIETNNGNELISNKPEGRSVVLIESDSRILTSNDSTVNPLEQRNTTQNLLTSSPLNSKVTELNETYLNYNSDLASIIGDAENDEKIMRS